MKHKHQRNQMRRALPAFTAALFAAGVITNANAQVQTAGTLFVNVDATSAAAGPLTSIPNTGTLGGVFAAAGSATEAPIIATVGQTKGIQFDGTDFLELMTAATGGTPITAPAELTGLNPTQSIEVWAFNPQIATEETLVSWGRRGGPDGSNVSFNYGSSAAFGAVGRWGNQDLGWNNQGGAPAAGQWHHLVYTYDGSTTKIYADGAFQNGEFNGEGRVDTAPDTLMLIGAQSEPDAANGGFLVTGGLRLTGTIGKVRVHDGVLTAEQVAANYNAEKATFIDPPPQPQDPPIVSAPLSKGPVHRYSFNETAGDATDRQFVDSVQTAHGNVLGAGTTFSGSRLVLPGGSSADAAYGDLPNGLLSSNGVANAGSGQFAIESWFKVTGVHNWSRVFDFGSSGNIPTEEVVGPGGGGEGRDYFMYSTMNGTDTGNRRLELRNVDPTDQGITTVDNRTATFNQDVHVVVTWDEATGRLVTYENGLQVATTTTDDKMSDINDINIWLGRSNWTGDENTQGEFDEVRLYDHVLSPGEVLGSAFAGPNKLSTEPAAVTITTQPASVTGDETGNVTFTAAVTGSSPIQLQWYKGSVAIPGAVNPTLTVTNLTAADNNASFTLRATNTVNGTVNAVTSNPAVLTVQTPTVTLRHRYSFNETSGETVDDSVGSADGTVMNGGGTFGGGQLTLDGIQGYVDLPNGTVSGLGTNATFELWLTHRDANSVWARIFDFGTSNGGEDVQDSGRAFFFLVARNGDGMPMFEATFDGTGPVAQLFPAPPGWIPGNEETHVVITWSASGNISRMYINGVLVATRTAPRPLTELEGLDVNNWLGKSQWPDAYWGGSYNEVRLYSGAMTPSQVAASFAAGPNPGTGGGSPTLTVSRSGNNLTISWPASATGYALESTTALGAGAVWTPVNGATLNGTDLQVTVPTDGTQRYFRLRKP